MGMSPYRFLHSITKLRPLVITRKSICAVMIYKLNRIAALPGGSSLEQKWDNSHILYYHPIFELII